MAEAVFRTFVEDVGPGPLVRVGSAGTGGRHEGDRADPRTVTVPEASGCPSDHVARQCRAEWFGGLDLVVALDEGHLRALRRLAPKPAYADKVRLLRAYDPARPDGLDVPDPDYGTMTGFEDRLEMVKAAGKGSLDAVRNTREERAV